MHSQYALYLIMCRGIPWIFPRGKCLDFKICSLPYGCMSITPFVTLPVLSISSFLALFLRNSVYSCLCLSVCVNVCFFMFFVRLFECWYVCAFVCVCVCVSVCVCAFVFCVYVSVYVCVCICVRGG